MAIDICTGSTDTLNVQAPHISTAIKSNESTTLVLTMENATDELIWEDGSENDFILEGTTDSVIGGTVMGNHLVLQLSGTADGLSSVSYTGHPITATPFVKNLNGVGMLCFDKFPVETLSTTQETYIASKVQLRLSPNPGRAGGNLVLNLESAPSSPITLNIYDLLGKRVASQNLEPSLDKSAHFFEAPTTPGVYLVHIQSKEGSLGVIKLVVQRH